MSTLRLTPEQVRRQWAHRPCCQAGAPIAATALVGIQAQILPTAGLALWNRIADLNENRFHELLDRRRTLVSPWGQRSTLHLYASSDRPLLHAAGSINLV